MGNSNRPGFALGNQPLFRHLTTGRITALSTTQVQTASHTQWDRITLIMFVGIVAAFHVGKVPSALPDIRVDLGIGMVSAGWIVSVYTGVAVVMALAAGVLADRLGHRNTLLGGLLLLAAGSAAGSAMDTQPALVAMRLVEGVGFVLIVVSAPSLILRATAPRDHSVSLGIWAAFMPIGVTGMLLIAPFVLTQFGWRGLWQLNAAIPLAAFFVVLAMLRRPAASAAPRPPIGRIWSDLKITVARPGAVAIVRRVRTAVLNPDKLVAHLHDRGAGADHNAGGDHDGHRCLADGGGRV